MNESQMLKEDVEDQHTSVVDPTTTTATKATLSDPINSQTFPNPAGLYPSCNSHIEVPIENVNGGGVGSDSPEKEEEINAISTSNGDNDGSSSGSGGSKEVKLPTNPKINPNPIPVGIAVALRKKLSSSMSSSGKEKMSSSTKKGGSDNKFPHPKEKRAKDLESIKSNPPAPPPLKSPGSLHLESNLHKPDSPSLLRPKSCLPIMHHSNNYEDFHIRGSPLYPSPSTTEWNNYLPPGYSPYHQQMIQMQHNPYTSYGYPSPSYPYTSSGAFSPESYHFYDQLLHQQQQQDLQRVQQQQLQRQLVEYELQRAGTPRITIPSPSPTLISSQFLSHHHPVAHWATDLYHASSTTLSPKSLSSSTPSPITVDGCKGQRAETPTKGTLGGGGGRQLSFPFSPPIPPKGPLEVPEGGKRHDFKRLESLIERRNDPVPIQSPPSDINCNKVEKERPKGTQIVSNKSRKSVPESETKRKSTCPAPVPHSGGTKSSLVNVKKEKHLFEAEDLRKFEFKEEEDEDFGNNSQSSSFMNRKYFSIRSDKQPEKSSTYNEPSQLQARDLTVCDPKMDRDCDNTINNKKDERQYEGVHPPRPSTTVGALTLDRGIRSSGESSALDDLDLLATVAQQFGSELQLKPRSAGDARRSFDDFESHSEPQSPPSGPQHPQQLVLNVPKFERKVEPKKARKSPVKRKAGDPEKGRKRAKSLDARIQLEKAKSKKKSAEPGTKPKRKPSPSSKGKKPLKFDVEEVKHSIEQKEVKKRAPPKVPKVSRPKKDEIKPSNKRPASNKPPKEEKITIRTGNERQSTKSRVIYSPMEEDEDEDNIFSINRIKSVKKIEKPNNHKHADLSVKKSSNDKVPQNAFLAFIENSYSSNSTSDFRGVELKKKKDEEVKRTESVLHIKQERRNSGLDMNGSGNILLEGGGGSGESEESCDWSTNPDLAVTAIFRPPISYKDKKVSKPSKHSTSSLKSQPTLKQSQIKRRTKSESQQHHHIKPTLKAEAVVKTSIDPFEDKDKEDEDEDLLSLPESEMGFHFSGSNEERDGKNIPKTNRRKSGDVKPKSQPIREKRSSRSSIKGSEIDENCTVPIAKKGDRVMLTNVSEFVDEMRILTEIQGLFYRGKLVSISDGNVYGVTLDNERGAPPHLIFSAEEVLEKCIRELRPPAQLTHGLRICAYWSPQYRGLYPGRISQDYNPNSDPVKDLIPIEFDDGDTGVIKLGEIRLLESNHPTRAYDPNPLLTLEKKQRKRRHSNSNANEGSCNGDHEEPDCGENFCAKLERTEQEEGADDEGEEDDSEEDYKPTKMLFWTWNGLGYKRPQCKKNRNKEFFRGIQRGDEEIKVGDSALFLGGNERPFIGRIEKFYEKKGRKVVDVRWFYHPEEVKARKRLPTYKYPGALFESPHIDENDVQTIAKRCEVLPFEEYKKKIGGVPRISAPKRSSVNKLKSVYYIAGFYDPYTYNLKLKDLK